MTNPLELLASSGFITLNKKIVKVLGLHEAVLLGLFASKQLYYNNEWFYCTYDDITEETTISKYQASKAIKSLIDTGMLLEKNEGTPKKRYFMLNYDQVINFLTFNFFTSCGLKTSPLYNILQENNNILINNNTENNNTKNIAEVKSSPKKQSKKRYPDKEGSVLISEKEYGKLVDRFGKIKTNEWIERLDLYIKSKGVKYKSHYHTILNWDKMEKERSKENTKKEIEGDEDYGDAW